MDTNNQNQINEKEDSGLELLNDSINNLNETGKWAKFLAILGFVFIGLIIIMGFSFGIIFSIVGGGEFKPPFPSFLFGFIYLVFGLIYFFPILYLFRFSIWTKKALNNKNTNDLNLAFRNLKAHYRYIGIMMIIILGIYALFFIILLAGGLLFGFMK